MLNKFSHWTMEKRNIYGGKAISDKYVLKFILPNMASLRRFHFNMNLIPDSWRNCRGSTYANIELRFRNKTFGNGLSKV